MDNTDRKLFDLEVTVRGLKGVILDLRKHVEELEKDIKVSLTGLKEVTELLEVGEGTEENELQEVVTQLRQEIKELRKEVKEVSGGMSPAKDDISMAKTTCDDSSQVLLAPMLKLQDEDDVDGDDDKDKDTDAERGKDAKAADKAKTEMEARQVTEAQAAEEAVDALKR
eukprot:gnl/MRDRNA2_/MRDRNA2_118238_c0_seq1.p1 gnl/MRDRNA2_/MRDRNA2_118238_c0~~gnl/MRDRNA2_/MRDRNA2_118238_c0_seq1.p1  ORF type:complete len:169 (+),score=57.72 gnl/MRDRNA2_/MRDRNA2_118238_c0_seq1:215-721(+)